MKTVIITPENLEKLGYYKVLVTSVHGPASGYPTGTYHDTLKEVVKAEEYYLGMDEAEAKKESILVWILQNEMPVGYILANEEELA